MKAALYDERDGYYSRRDIVRRGRLGDYRTLPEMTPLFAATFARYLSKLFVELGSPANWKIMEVGAGFGEFAADVLRTLRLRHPNIFAATQYLIDEVTEDGRERTRVNLAGFEDKYDLFSLGDAGAPTVGVIFSNELIDAFPVHRIKNCNGVLHSVYVGVDDRDQFTWVETDLDPSIAEYCARANVQLDPGHITEINPDADVFVTHAARLLARGYVITVDYGDERQTLLSDSHRRQGTLRAAYHHQISDDVLQQPGSRDLTTTIDWTQLREAGDRAGLSTILHDRLDSFLLAEGLLDELEAMASNADPVGQAILRAGARELIVPNGMAASFQVLVQRKTHD